METTKLNKDWQERTNQLMQRQEDEKRCLRRLYEDGSALLREFIERKCKEMSEQTMSSALESFKVELEAEHEEVVEELAKQSKLFDEKMREMMKSLEFNDLDWTEELRAMVVHHHSLVCRHVTELMQLMAVKQRQREMKNERKAQSGSLKHLWEDFLSKLHEFVRDEQQLDAEEARILSEVHRVRRELVMEATRRRIDGKSEVKPDELLIIHENGLNCHGAMDKSTLEWVAGKSTPFPEVERKRLDKDQIEISTDLFASPRPLSSLQSIQEIASSIIAMARESADESELRANITKVIEKLVDDRSSMPTNDDISTPKPETLGMRESCEELGR